VYVPNELYDLSKANSWLDQAMSANDIESVVGYLNNSLRELAGRSGNPCWWFPTVETDFDSIKEAIRVTANQGLLLEDDFARQQYIHNIGEYELPELEARISETSEWIVNHQGVANWSTQELCSVAWFILWVLWIIFAFATS